jgi:hypothetical protein
MSCSSTHVQRPGPATGPLQTAPTLERPANPRTRTSASARPGAPLMPATSKAPVCLSDQDRWRHRPRCCPGARRPARVGSWGLAPRTCVALTTRACRRGAPPAAHLNAATPCAAGPKRARRRAMPAEPPPAPRPPGAALAPGACPWKPRMPRISPAAGAEWVQGGNAAARGLGHAPQRPKRAMLPRAAMHAPLAGRLWALAVRDGMGGWAGLGLAAWSSAWVIRQQDPAAGLVSLINPARCPRQARCPRTPVTHPTVGGAPAAGPIGAGPG